MATDTTIYQSDIDAIDRRIDEIDFQIEDLAESGQYGDEIAALEDEREALVGELRAMDAAVES